jgi:aryl-alcohol dehydrogenase-like predicted oxidoreductase
MGLQAKLSQNMILGNLLQAFNESFVLSTKAGVPPQPDAGHHQQQRSEIGHGGLQGAGSLRAQLHS